MNRLSLWGLIPAIAYIAAAVAVIWNDRTSVSGGWISLNGMSSFLATLPVSAFFEVVLKSKLDFRSTFDMAVAIGLCAVLVYLLGAGVGTLFK